MHQENKGPLDGIIIADFSRVLAGPYATMLLADMGATVIKVEPPIGDETRHWAPPMYEGESTYYLSINRNKRSIALDFKSEHDLTIAKDLAKRADVVIENFKPFGLEKFGLDFNSVKETNPNVIYTSITGFGTAGGKNMPGYDLLVQAMSGHMSITGSSEDNGYRSGVAIFDVITGLHAAIATLSALYHRAMTGQGQHLEVNLMSSALSGMPNMTGAYALAGSIGKRIGNDHPSIFPYAPFQTKDGQIVLAIGNDRQFKTFCALIDAPYLSENSSFATNSQRSENREELRTILIELLSTRTAAEWFDILQPEGIPCAPQLNIAEGVEFAEKIGLEPIKTVSGSRGIIPTISHPISYSETPPSYALAPPELDGNRQEILDWLQSSSTAERTSTYV